MITEGRAGMMRQRHPPSVAEDGALARRKQGGDEVPFLGEQCRRDRRVHPAVQAVQPARAERAADRRTAGARDEQLLPRHDPVPLDRDRANCFGYCPLSGHKPKQLRHPLMVGLHAVPALHAFVPTPRRTRRETSAHVQPRRD
ncbi:MAG TPA: hypothetical protein VH231_00975 [Solirubrobacteraceae bacterium]|nr:hypothetical protein [Solirubrobacteraceae bacterium]